MWNRLKTGWYRSFALWKEILMEDILLKRQREWFWLIFGGHIFFQTLRAAVALDLFGLLSKRPGLTRSQIAASLGLEEKPVRILLLGLTALGLVRKAGGVYSNRAVAQRVLRKDRPGNVTSYIEFEHAIIYKAMAHFTEALKANRNVGLKELRGDEPTLYERLAHEPELLRIFHDAMDGLSRQANESLIRGVDWSGFRSVVDVGGGDGTNLIALARRYPHLKGRVFDLPSACQLAQERIRAAGLSDRLGTVSGNAFRDPFPPGADCLLFAHFFTMWSEEKDRALLAKACQALPSRGAVILFNMMQNNDETGPFATAMGSPYFLTLATGEGMLYTWKEYESWMAEAGFARIRRYRLPRDHGAIIGVK